MICIGCSRIMVFADRVETTFPDKAVSRFYPPADSVEFQNNAREFGYLSALQFGLEHDVAHSWLAVQTGKLFSEVVWADAHGGERKQDPKVYEDEEHFANRMLLYINTGKLDDDYGVLNNKFGAMLPTMGARLWRILRSNLLDEVNKNVGQ